MKFWSWFIFTFVFLFMVSCMDESYTSNPNDRLVFSVDTLSFDTLFSEIPSRTKSLLVYNPHKKAINISNIALTKGSSSFFRINIDGIIPNSSNSASDIEIKAKDSLIIFVELTIDKQNQNTPVRIEDALQFSTNKGSQKVLLEAYSRDAIIYHSKQVLRDTTLTGDQPFVVYDYLYVSEGATLTLSPGTQIYFHSNANFIVNGTVIAEGTKEEPITIQGDRLDKMADVDQTPYSHMSGQWGALYLQGTNSRCELNNTSIMGGTYGILLLGSTGSNMKLIANNSRIHMVSNDGIYAVNGDISLSNCEISCCGKSCLNFVGGKHSITHCTIANYYEWATRKEPAVVLSNYYIDGNWMYLYPLQSAVFQNSIIAGNMKNELTLNKDTLSQQENAFNTYFSYCYIKAPKSSSAEFNNIIWSTAANSTSNSVKEEIFMNATISKTNKYYDFMLIKSSAARNAANIEISNFYPNDMKGYNRFADGRPDMGAYEWHQ